MAQNKGAIVRYRAIDRCLRAKHGENNPRANKAIDKQVLLMTNYQIQEYESCPYPFF